MINDELRIKNNDSTSPPAPPQAWGGWLKAGRGRNMFLIIICGIFLITFSQKVTAPVSSPNSPLPLAQDKPQTITLLAVGDIMLSRNVSSKIEKANDPNLPFNNLKETLSSADIAFGNLECPLAEGNARIYEGLIFRCLTKDFEGVINAGFDVLSTANNHSFDQGLDNIEFTVNYLKSKNILPVGTVVSNSIELDSSINNIIERNGIKFGFLAYSYSARNDGGKSTHPQISTIPPLSPPYQGGGKEGVLQSEISNLKSSGADFVIVSMHAGYEYTRTPNADQITFAHTAIDAGADIVLGHHPHWIQPIEVYSPTTQLSPDEGRVPRAESRGREVKKGLIFYSLGNFVFDQMWSQDTREGLMVEFEFSGKNLKQAKLIPVIIENYSTPRPATEEEAKRILEKIGQTEKILK